MSFFSSIIGGPQSFLGVDLGTASIKVAEIRKAGDQVRLENYGILESLSYLERFNEVIQASSLKLSETHAATYLKILLNRTGVKAKVAVASVPAFSAFSTLIEAPQMSTGETKNFIELQAKQYVPMPLSEVAFDWVKVGDRMDEGGIPKQQLLLVSIPKENVEKYQKLFKIVGIELKEIEVEGMALARSLTTGSKETSLIVDIGSRSTSLSVAEAGYLKFSGQTDFSGGSLTQSIGSGLGISHRRAEDLKRQRGLMGFGGTRELSTLIEPMLDVIINEAKRVIGSYETNYRGKIQSIILAGGGANLLGIEDYTTKAFGLPVRKGNPFPQVTYPQFIDPIAKDTGPLLAVAIGLGIKGFL